MYDKKGKTLPGGRSAELSGKATTTHSHILNNINMKGYSLLKGYNEVASEVSSCPVRQIKILS